MSDRHSTTALPARRSSLVLRALPDVGQFVVKDGQDGFFDLDEHSYFLLEQLDGQSSAEQVREAFQQRYAAPLTAEELAEFIDRTGELGLLVEAPSALASADGSEPGTNRFVSAAAPVRPAPASRNNLLYFRVRIIDPDRLLTWLAPRLRVFLTPAFVIVATLCIFAAAGIAWSRRADLLRDVTDALAWRTFVLAWVTIGLVTVLHEFAHGLTCKYFGGEVREMGVLMLLFMPCFYVNVSDAWLLPKTSQRLWVTFAGGFFELWIWALAVFAWAVLQPGTLPHRAAWLIAALCGMQTLFNFNPLIKLDGYYLLSDWLAIPNLQQRGIERFRTHTRRLLWGGPPPDSDSHGGVLTGFGIASWCFSVFFLSCLCLALFRWAAHSAWGGAAMTVVGLLSVLSIGGLFSGFLGGEVISMLRTRHLRTIGWLGATGLAIAGLFLIEIEDRAAGPFLLRAETRVEIQAPVAGFLRQVYVDEGDSAAAGMVLCRLDVPELAVHLARKRAEREAAAAQLALLRAGTRAEEIAAQRLRVERAVAARDLAEQHFDRSRAAHAAESDRRQQQIGLSLAELKTAESALTRARSLREQNALSASDFDAAEAHREVCRARVEQARAEHRAHAAAGVLEEEQELALRTRELGEAQSVLTLMEAGTRPEEIAAQDARVRQLEADICELEAIAAKQTVDCPAHGVVLTPHLRDKLGQYLVQGALICEVASTERLTAEVALTEDAARRVAARQPVHLQPRGLTSGSVETSVWRIGPAAAPGAAEVGKLPSTITVACRLSMTDNRLRPGMSGYARIDTGRRSIAAILHDRVRHYVRTEFWW